METQRNYDDFTYVPNLLFKSMGYDFLNTPKPKWQHLLMRIYWIICLTSHLYIVYYLILRTVQWEVLDGNPTAIMRYSMIYFFVINTDVKCIIFMFYRRRLRELNSKLRALYPSEEFERREYRVNEFYWPRGVRYAIYYFFFVAFLVLTGPIMQSTCLYLYQRYTMGGKATFVYVSAYPMKRFESMTPMTYVLSQCIDFAFSHYIMNVNLGTDIWVMCLSAQLSLHFAHLGRQLAAYSPSRQGQFDDCQFLIRLVRKHQLLFGLHKELNEIYGMLLAFNLFSTATILCCVAFYTILKGLNLEGIGFLLFFFSYSTQFYMLCYYGQLLIDWSKSIALAAYENKWYNGTPAYRKHLLLIMQRAQKPTELSAKGVIIISLDTFKNMMNITYRFFAVIRRLLGK